MSELGKKGRFGNQLVQYMFAKTYARTHGLKVQLPRWIGTYLFGCKEEACNIRYPVFEEEYRGGQQAGVLPRFLRPVRNVNFVGFFQYHTSYYSPHQAYIRTLFRPAPEIKERLSRGIAHLRQLGKTIVAIHVRRGDAGFSYYYRTPITWYREWLNGVWPTLDQPALYIASDEPDAVKSELAPYSPVTARDLGMSLPRAPYFPDFYVLTQADCLAIPNSTFSFVAAMLNENLRLAVRSELRDPLGHPPFKAFDPWYAPMLDTSARVEQFPHIPEIARANPHSPQPPQPRWRTLKRWLANRWLMLRSQVC